MEAGPSAIVARRPSVFDFESFGSFFSAAVESLRRDGRSHVSWRSLAKRLSVQSPSLLLMVAQGKRRAQADLVARICAYLSLTPQETEYAEALADLERARSAPVQGKIVARLRALKPSNSELMLALDAFSLIGRWHHLVLLELVTLGRFRDDPEALAAILGNGVDAQAVSESLSMLERLGLVRRDESGVLKKTAEKVRTPLKSSLAIRSYHKQMLSRAAAAIDKQSIEERYVTSLTIPVPMSQLAAAKRRISEFRDAFAREMAQVSDGSEEVYHLNMQFFRATQELAFPSH